MTHILLSPTTLAGADGASDLVCVGPPTLQTLARVRDRICDADSGVDGAIIDLRAGEIEEVTLTALAELRRPLMDWLTHSAGAHPRVVPITVLCADAPAVRRLLDFAERVYDCPSFWFATGWEILAHRRFDGATDDDGNLFRDGLLALDRLRNHPLVADGDRAEELRACAVDALGPGLDAFERPWHPSGTRRHLQIIVPSTYQLRGGGSVLLSTPHINEVLRYLVVELTARARGVPSHEAGCTILRGEGWWYSPQARRWIDEEVRSAHIYLRIEPRQARSVVRYLRFAWLQDTIFCTLDGRAVEPEEPVDPAIQDRDW
jgi:hypothetical protein